MKKIILIGSLVYDQIYYLKNNLVLNQSNPCSNTDFNIGGVGNYFNFLKNYKNISLDIDSSVGNDSYGSIIEKYFSKYLLKKNHLTISKKLLTSNATILVDSKNVKTSFVYWSACKNKYYSNIYNNSWCHIAYLDILDKISINYLQKLRKYKNIVSADMCSSSLEKKKLTIILKKISYLDYLIISDNEAFSLFPNLKSLKKICKLLGEITKVGTIIHFKNGSIFSNGNKITSALAKKVSKNYNSKNKVINGAGDIFSASFIYSIINKKNIINSIKLAHSDAFKYVNQKLK